MNDDEIERNRIIVPLGRAATAAHSDADSSTAVSDKGAGAIRSTLVRVGRQSNERVE